MGEGMHDSSAPPMCNLGMGEYISRILIKLIVLNWSRNIKALNANVKLMHDIMTDVLEFKKKRVPSYPCGSLAKVESVSFTYTFRQIIVKSLHLIPYSTVSRIEYFYIDKKTISPFMITKCKNTNSKGHADPLGNSETIQVVIKLLGFGNNDHPFFSHTTFEYPV